MRCRTLLRVLGLALALGGVTFEVSAEEGARQALEVRIECPLEEIKVGDEIPIVFTITNSGNSVYFYHDGVSNYYDRLSLMGQYELIVSDENRRVVEGPFASRYSGISGGGGLPRTGVEPGSSLSRTVPLNQWALIKEAGRYTVRGIYHTGIFHAAKKSPSVTSRPIRITLAPRSDEALQVYIDGLSERLDSIEIPETGMTKAAWTEIESVVRKLGYTCDARVVPVLLDAAYTYPHSGLWVADAVLRYVGPGPETREQVVATAQERGLG